MTQTTPQSSLIVFGVASARIHADRVARLSQLPAQVVILDPLIDPSTPPAHLIVGVEGTTLLDCIIGAQAGEAEFPVWSADGLMGPRPPLPSLQALFPRLRCARCPTVRVCAFGTLMATLMDLPDPITIWIDAPGSEADILDLVMASPLASRVAAISVRTGIEVFFEGARDSKELISDLEALNFRLATRNDEDPDFPELVFQIDPSRLKAEIVALTEARDTAQAAEAERAAGLEAELKAVKQERHDMWQARDKARAELEAAQDALAQLGRVTQERDTTQQELAGLQALGAVLESRLADLIADNDAMSAQTDALRAELAALTEARDTAQAAEAERAAGLEAELKAVKQERHDMWQARDKARAELSETEAAAKAEIDTLQGQVRDLKQRQSLAKDELRRAEGQVELIKDLLLREAVL